ncbi:MAG: hypothetical protein ACREL7_11640 [Longimicrobiales bacterium]
MCIVIAIFACGIIGPSSLQAQGAGSTGATVLQLLAGGRAAALSGAYAAAQGDSDVLFYNPAGIAALDAAAGLSYQRHVEEIGVATGSAAFRVGRIVLGASAIFLDYGDIDELVPDPDFGGQTGMPTGNTVSATETAARVAAGLPLLDGRLNVGGAAGFVSNSFAGATRGTVLFDVGAQYVLSRITFGAALRNIGGSLSGGGLADAALPTEARAGAMLEMTQTSGLGFIASADLVHELNAGLTGVVAGVEAGLFPNAASQIGAVARAGYDAGTGEDGQGALRLGGGLSVGRFAFDYAYQNYELFGSLHRFGVRWMRAF